MFTNAKNSAIIELLYVNFGNAFSNRISIIVKVQWIRFKEELN